MMHPISDMLKYEYNVGLGMDKLQYVSVTMQNSCLLLAYFILKKHKRAFHFYKMEKLVAKDVVSCCITN